MATLLQVLQEQGLITAKESQVGQGLSRVVDGLKDKTTSTRVIPISDAVYEDDYDRDMSSKRGYLQQQIDKQNARDAQTGILTDNNLQSNNPLVRGATTLLNFGTQVAGGVVDIFPAISGGIAQQGAQATFSSLPDDVKDIYQREKNDADRGRNQGELQGILNARAEGKVSSLVGYDKKYKTQSELDDRIKLLESSISTAPVTDAERSVLDQTAPAFGKSFFRENDGRGLLSNKTKTYRDLINGIESDKAYSRKVAGNRSDPKSDNILGSRSWGNDLATQEYAEQYAKDSVESKKLDIAGREQRENATNAADYFAGWGKTGQSYLDSASAAIGAVKDNPMVISDLLAGTAPLLIGATSRAAMGGDALRIASESLQGINESNMTVGATDAQHALGIGSAAAYTALNKVEKDTLLGAVKGRTPGAAQLDKLSEGVSSVASRLGTKISDALPNAISTPANVIGRVLPLQAAARVARGAATTGAVEGGVETLQTQIEDQWSKGSTDIDTSKLAEAGVLGAAMGGVMSAPGSVANHLTGKLTKNMEQQATEQFGAASISNEDMLNPINPDFAPHKVVNRIINEEAITAGNYEGAKEQIDSIVNNINTSLTALKDEQQYVNNPQELLDRVATGEQFLEEFISTNTPETNPNFDAVVEITQGKINGLKEQHARITSPDYDNQTNLDAISRMTKSLADMEDTFTAFNTGYNAARERSEAEAQTNAPVEEQVTTEQSGTTTETVEQEATRHLGAPMSSNLQRIAELVEDETVPEAIRGNLRIVSEALLAANKAKSSDKVSKEVVKGETGYRGTEQYLMEMGKAISDGDTGRQESLLTQMDYFKQSRNDKLSAIQQAAQVADSSNKSIQVVKPNNGAWVALTDTRVPESEFRANNGLLIRPNKSSSLVKALQNDIEVINTASNALNAMRGTVADSFNSQANALRDDQLTAQNVQQPAEFNPVQEALDELNIAERNEAQQINLENNEGDLIDNTNQPIKNASIQAMEGPNNAQEGIVETLSPSMANTAGGVDTPSFVDPIEIESQNGLDVSLTTEPIKPKVKKKAKPAAKKVPVKPAKFSAKSTFKSKSDADKYLSDNKRDNDFYTVTDKGVTTLVRKAKPVDQPNAPSDTATAVANERGVSTQPTQVSVSESNVSARSTEATKFDTGVNESIVDVESNTTQAPEVIASPEGSISSMDTAGLPTKEVVSEERTKPFNKQNLLKAGFVQKLRDGFNSPLVTTKNYLSGITKNSRKSIVEAVQGSTGKTPNEAQVKLLNAFIKFNFEHGIADSISTSIKARTNPDYRYLHFTDYLLNEDGTLDENTTTAIAASIFSWVGENATKITNNDKDIGKILGIKNVDNLPPSVEYRLGKVGTHQNTLAAELGQRIYQSLQFSMFKDVDTNRQRKLEQVLGTIAVGIMVETGLAERTRITNGELFGMSLAATENLGSADPNVIMQTEDVSEASKERLSDKAMSYFIRPATEVDANDKLVPSKYTRLIHELHADTKGIMSSMFGFTPYTTLPSLEPITTLPDTFNEFEGKLPSMVKEALLKQQSAEYKLNIPMVNLARELSKSESGKKALDLIIGIRDPKDSHIAFETSIDSVNEAASRSMRHLFDTFDHVGSNGFYLPSTVWSNFRNGNPPGFNSQADKLHRAFSSLDSDMITVPVSNEVNYFNEDGSLTEYGMFLRGLGFRIEDVSVEGMSVDKAELEKFIPAFDALTKSQEVTEAADALNSLLQGDVSNKNLTVVTDLLVKWEMNALGLSALMAINDRNQALKAGKSSFDVRLAADSDGLVNGPAISNILMNTGSSEFMQSVGVFPFADNEADQLKSVQQLKTRPDAKDPYEQLAELQLFYYDMLPTDNTKAGLATRALRFLDPEYGKRKGAKRALTPFNYGAGFDSVNRANARGTLNAIYKELDKAGHLYTTDQVSANKRLSDISKSINVLISYSNDNTNSRVQLTIPQVLGDMSSMLTTEQEQAIKHADFIIRGAATKEALSDLLAPYIGERNSKNAIANTSFDLFNQVFTIARNDAETAKIVESNELVKQGKLPTVMEVNGKVIELLTAEDKQKLLRDMRKYMPTLATPVGIESKEVEMSSIPLIDVATVWDNTNQMEVVFSRGFGSVFTDESSNGPLNTKSKTTTYTTGIRDKQFTSPGVAGGALYTQAHDAYVAYRVQLVAQGQNYHDSVSTNAYKLNSIAAIQNEAFLDSVTISHIGKAYTEALTKTIKGVIAYKDKLGVDAKKQIEGSIRQMLIASSIIDPKDKSPIDYGRTLTQLYAKNFQNDLDKMSSLIAKESIHQYATEGGGYTLDDAKRKQITKRTNELKTARDESLKAIKGMAAELQTILTVPTKASNRKPNSTVPVESVIENNAEKAVAAEVKEAKSKDTLHTELLSNKEKYSDPAELINLTQKTLFDYLKAEGTARKYAVTYNELLSMAKVAVHGSDLKINILDGTEDTSSVLGYDIAVKEKMIAWYADKGGKKQINFRMTDKQPIDSKVVTHELLHAVTAMSMDIVRANPKKYPKAMESLQKLERLYEHVKSKVTKADHHTIQYGVSKLDEFIATGLTYPSFMNYLDSITDIPVEARSKRGLSTAFRAIVTTMLDVLYAVAGKGRTYNTKTLSAYEALVLDTAEFVHRSEGIKSESRNGNLFGAPTERSINEVTQYTALEVFNSLEDGKLQGEFKEQLANVITNVTDKLFSTLPHKYAQTKNGYTPDAIWNKALQDGKAPYITKAIAAGFSMSAQEQFGVEALEVALLEATKAGSVTTAYRSISKGFEEAKKVLKPSDFVQGNWNDATADAKQAAERKYNYIFKVGQSDYITRFTAMALGNQEFNTLLTMKLQKDLFKTSNKPTFDRLVDLANKAVNYTSDRLTNSLGKDTVQGKLPHLASALVDIDLKNRNKSVSKLEQYYNNADAVANDTLIGLKTKAGELAMNSPLAMFQNKYTNIITNTIKATKDGRSPIVVMDGLMDFRAHENPNQRLGFLGELGNEIADQNSAQLIGEKYLSYAKHTEGTAQRIRTVVKNDVLSRFKNDGQDLTREVRTAVTQGLLRTDAQSLLPNYGYDGLVTMVTDREALNKEIRKLEGKLNNDIKRERTEALGFYMVHGIGDEMLAKNPTLIAQNAGLGFRPSNVTDADIKLIDDLATLYALKFTDSQTLKHIKSVIESEKDGENGGGIYALVKYHESLAQESYETLFSNNIASYTKGYMPNKTNPHKDVVVAFSDADKDRLRTSMYTDIGNVTNSDLDPNRKIGTMFYTEDSGTQSHVSGAMALYNYGRKGTEIELTIPERVAAINKARSNLINGTNKRDSMASRAIPTYDTNGNIIAYNYEMSSRIRDTYLERDNDFSVLIGEYTATGYNKTILPEQNKAVADALIDSFNNEYAKDPNGFLYVGAGVSDPVLSQSWALIPKEIRDHIYKRTGNNGIYVHNRAYLTIFGSKKYSITESFDKTADMQNIAEKLFVGTMRAFFSDSAKVRTAKGERMWQEAVKLLKDIVIIRNVSTALINIMSNSFLLLSHGVSPTDIIKNTVQSIKAGGEYRKNSAELIKLQNRQRIDVGNADEIQQRINILQQRIDKNPLKSFIDEGMFAGIVEDIDMDNQSYTYASGIQRKYEGVIDKVPKSVRNAAKHIVVAPGTPLYQFLHSVTQYGDFSAKYVMYKHFTETAKDKLTHDEAITRASNNFINYDVPTSQGMQYLNDMGLFMFTKYNLRIQKALFELLGRKPATAIGQAMLINAVSNLPPGIDPLVFNQIGNPMRNGPLGLLGAWDEPLPINMIKSIF